MLNVGGEVRQPADQSKIIRGKVTGSHFQQSLEHGADGLSFLLTGSSAKVQLHAPTARKTIL
jgi:hypothetical protein